MTKEQKQSSVTDNNTHKNKPKSRLAYIQKLAELIANITESYTTVIFLCDEDNNLVVTGHHSLSDDFRTECKITNSNGLIGWVKQNAKKINVSPFNHDSTTLLYYKTNQELKSFMAIPVIENEQVIGVIACDSKKSYAYAQITEKILAETAELLIQYLKSFKTSKKIEAAPKQDKGLTSQLKSVSNEQELFNLTSILLNEIIDCETLAIVTNSTNLHSAQFYCDEKDKGVQNNLMKLVLRKKRALYSNQSIQTKSAIDKKACSFLSVPFKVLDSDAGSFNFLSKPGIPFNAAQVKQIETIAKQVGESLERIRLKQRAKAFSNQENIVSWNHFVSIAKEQITKSVHNKNSKNREDLSLCRISIGKLEQLEAKIGIAKTQDLLASIFRIIQQLISHPAVSCKLLGTDILVLAEKTQAASMNHRLIKLMSKIEQPQISKMIINEINITTVTTNIDGSSFSELIRALENNQNLETTENKKAIA